MSEQAVLVAKRSKVSLKGHQSELQWQHQLQQLQLQLLAMFDNDAEPAIDAPQPLVPHKAN